MPSILVGSLKGGTGKSTICLQLATYFASRGVDVMLLDADPQCSSSRFIERRNDAGIEPRIHCANASGNIYATVRDLSQRYELVIVDTGGYSGRELHTGALAADLLYVPIRASQVDLETLPEMLDTVIVPAKDRNPDLRSYVLISQGPTNPMIHETAAAKAALAEFPDLTLSRVVVRERKIYRDATLSGTGVVECSNPAAKAEIQLLGQEIETLLAKKETQHG